MAMVWIPQAAGLLLFLNKAFFLTDQWMTLTVETYLLKCTVCVNTGAVHSNTKPPEQQIQDDR